MQIQRMDHKYPVRTAKPLVVQYLIGFGLDLLSGLCMTFAALCVVYWVVSRW
jgi:hypothetical protein